MYNFGVVIWCFIDCPILCYIVARSCNFETDGDWCGWIVSPQYAEQWSRGGFPAPEPGPTSDHAKDSLTHDIYISSDSVSVMPGHFAY